MKGIILAAGRGSRLFPLTISVNKQLMPIYDKPLIYYPLALLMEAEIKDILLISSVQDLDLFKRQLGDGSQFGINITYDVQVIPEGTADAFKIGKNFVGNDDVALIFGDNIFYSPTLKEKLLEAKKDASNNKATLFGFEVSDPERCGVVEFDEEGKVISIEEKPLIPKSNYALTGLYFYDNSVIDLAFKIEKSERGEYEVPEINKLLLKEDRLKVSKLEDTIWLDSGTFDSLLESSIVIKNKQEEIGELICSPELIAYKNNWITKEQLDSIGKTMEKNSYGQGLLNR